MNNFNHKVEREREHERVSRLTTPKPSMLLKPPMRDRLLLRRINPCRGVQIDGVWYWHPRFSQAGQSEPVDVRRLPWNLSVISVRFRGDWIAAHLEQSDFTDVRFDEVEFCRREKTSDLEELRMWSTLAELEMLEPRTDTESTR